MSLLLNSIHRPPASPMNDVNVHEPQYGNCPWNTV